jgi:hypothetical protein
MGRQLMKLDVETLKMRFLLRGRDIYPDLGLIELAFPLSRIWPETKHPQTLLDNIKIWQSDNAMHLPWHSDPTISEGKTKAEMVKSLMSEPIRKPIGLAIVPCIGFALLDVPGNNRLSAAMLRGLSSIPAIATGVMWPRGATEPNDDEAISAWRSVVDGSAPTYDPPAALQEALRLADPVAAHQIRLLTNPDVPKYQIRSLWRETLYSYAGAQIVR